ncbi:hypothetical protein POVCU2_0051180 [Plasmodium ovale curtisi]|uniref:Uncharacterized protein n=1 Tax=Plasmodium ovale curtisi TaxID=864141 RepID=A0A1A8X044_PLAOA|nr:hypothetical protein POVCU2_0051180 [Plasmodium ovale curtisi]SBS98614.1 hypothetical protein POVCU1_047490 [Plasmodium ovale curtisi]
MVVCSYSVFHAIQFHIGLKNGGENVWAFSSNTFEKKKWHRIKKKNAYGWMKSGDTNYRKTANRALVPHVVIPRGYMQKVWLNENEMIKL